MLCGWSTLDPKNADAKKAAMYAVSVTYPSAKTAIKIVTVKVQVVSGYKYDMNIVVTLLGSSRSCSMQNYVVLSSGDILLKGSTYTLVSKTALTSRKCRSK